MRLCSMFGFLLTAIAVSACSPAPVQSGPDNGPGFLPVAAEGGCSVKNLVSNRQGSQPGEKQGLDPQSISVLNWNVYKGQRQGWAEEFGRYIQAHDVVTMQEARLDDGLQSLLDRGHANWSLNAAFFLEGKATGVMTASGVMPVHSCGQQTTEPVIRTAKTSLISYFLLNGRDEQLLVANIHGVNFSLGLGAFREQIEQLHGEIRRHNGPVILAGDFNTWSDERLAIVNELADRLSLASLEYSSHNRTKMFGNPLDHVFYRGLRLVEQHTWHVASSDHNPIHAVFRVD